MVLEVNEGASLQKKVALFPVDGHGDGIATDEADREPGPAAEAIK